MRAARVDEIQPAQVEDDRRGHGLGTAQRTIQPRKP
jgi:hypothetical protein